MILKTHSLAIGYGNGKREPTPLVPPINLELHGPSFVALAGVNGAGKSTFLKTITGLLQPLAGEVELNGKPLKTLSAHEIALSVSIVLTEFPDDLFLRVEDVVAMGRYPYSGFWGRPGEEDHLAVMKSIELCNISHLKGRRIISLSDGEKQKTFIAKAIAQDTPFIVLDEPAAFLDYPGKLELMYLLRNLVYEQGKTILFSSHDLDLVLRHADRLWLLAPGVPFVEGTPEKLAVEGQIASFFNRRQIAFDTQTLHFFQTEQISNRIRLAPDLPHRKLILNVLARNGYTETNEISRFSVSFSKPDFLLHCGEKTHKCPDIDTLIQQIKSYET